ncbi:hypothetical protein EEX84_12270 [Planococcus salinus]|uniref:Uncharacterized protein n=1 Tax=Planococcus salinus TaxID=1848460 RepID=A0A3M8P5C7_9BACL|nr:hypothetical protein EEX84_12270 [Planococcus salinus]
MHRFASFGNKRYWIEYAVLYPNWRKGNLEGTFLRAAAERNVTGRLAIRFQEQTSDEGKYK